MAPMKARMVLKKGTDQATRKLKARHAQLVAAHMSRWPWRGCSFSNCPTQGRPTRMTMSAGGGRGRGGWLGGTLAAQNRGGEGCADARATKGSLMAGATLGLLGVPGRSLP